MVPDRTTLRIPLHVLFSFTNDFVLFFFQEKNRFVANLKDVTDGLPILVTEKSTVMFTRVTNLIIAKSGDATSLIPTHPVLENI